MKFTFTHTRSKSWLWYYMYFLPTIRLSSKEGIFSIEVLFLSFKLKWQW